MTHDKKTLLEIAREADPDGKASEVLEALAQDNPVLRPPGEPEPESLLIRVRWWLARQVYRLADRIDPEGGR